MATRGRRGLAERLSGAVSKEAIGNAIGDVLEPEVRCGTYNYVVLEPGVTDRPCMIVRSTRVDPGWGLRIFPELLLAVDRELGGLAAVLGTRQAYALQDRFPLETLRHTTTLNEYLRPAGSDQQLIAPLWSGGAPVGYFAVARTHREPAFRAEDLRAVEEVRGLAERALSNLGSLGTSGLSQTLEALSAVFPHPALLFDARGRLTWVSDEGIVRLELAAARLGAARLVAGNDALADLGRQARALAADPAADAERPLRRAGILRRGERLAIRRFESFGRPLVLLALVPAMISLPGESASVRARTLPALGAVESRVARLAAEGYSVLNIAAVLGVRETTIRTHLRRVYLKLGVHGRAEMASVLLRGAGGTATPGAPAAAARRW